MEIIFLFACIVAGFFSLHLAKKGYDKTSNVFASASIVLFVTSLVV